MTRRIVSLALSVFMLHLSVKRANLVCATHGAHASSPASAGHAVGGHHQGAGGAGAPTPADTQDCQTPSQDCCLAVVSCSTVLAFGDAREAVRAENSHEVVTAALQRRPSSRNTAPEPPPPKF